MLHACIVMPWKKVESDTLKYNTYNPYLKNGKFEVPLPAHEPSAYWSQMRSLEEFVSVLNMIDRKCHIIQLWSGKWRKGARGGRLSYK